MMSPKHRKHKFMCAVCISYVELTWDSVTQYFITLRVLGILFMYQFFLVYLLDKRNSHIPTCHPKVNTLNFKNSLRSFWRTSFFNIHRHTNSVWNNLCQMWRKSYDKRSKFNIKLKSLLCIFNQICHCLSAGQLNRTDYLFSPNKTSFKIQILLLPLIMTNLHTNASKSCYKFDFHKDFFPVKFGIMPRKRKFFSPITNPKICIQSNLSSGNNAMYAMT